MPDTYSLAQLGKWHTRMIGLAEHIAGWSKDPSTKCGAVITDDYHRIISVGFNGFPTGVPDEQDLLGDRAIKYEMVVHAEVNAILFSHADLSRGTTLYTWPFPPCSRCAAVIIQAGIGRVIAPIPNNDLALWHRHNCDRTVSMFKQAEVELMLIDLEKNSITTKKALASIG